MEEIRRRNTGTWFEVEYRNLDLEVQHSDPDDQRVKIEVQRGGTQEPSVFFYFNQDTKYIGFYLSKNEIIELFQSVLEAYDAHPASNRSSNGF